MKTRDNPLEGGAHRGYVTDPRVLEVTFVLSAALDALTLRALRRHIRHRPTTTRMSEASHRPVRSLVRP
jgi:hypothetical protein